MNRLERELQNRGIIYEADEIACMRGAEYDVDTKLVSVENGVITILWESAVMDPMFKLYDIHFNLIGEQDVYPMQGFSHEGRHLEWGSWCDEYHEKNGVNYLDRFGKYQMVYFHDTDEYYLVDMDAMTVLASGEHDEVWSLFINTVDKITRRCA